METITLAEVRSRFSELVDRVARQQDRVTITRNGRPAAVLLSPDDLESLEETLAVLSEPGALEEIREARAEIERGDVHSLEDIKREFGAAPREPGD